jgi:hypothetical protein
MTSGAKGQARRPGARRRKHFGPSGSLNAVQSAARSATAPISAAIRNLGIAASIARAEPDSRAAALADLLSKYSPPADDGLGAAFAQ